MEDSAIANLVTSFAYFYGSVPVSLARENIIGWHSEVTTEQFDRVLANIAGKPGKANVVLVTAGVPEPELVKGAWFDFAGIYEDFLKLRKDLPFASRSEEEILRYDSPEIVRFDIPETQALRSFAQTSLGLDNVGAGLAVAFVLSAQEESLWENKSWVLIFLEKLRRIGNGPIIRSLKDLKSFRDLGNSMYLHCPSQYLRGWKPAELENPPALPDDLPESEAALLRIQKGTEAELMNQLSGDSAQKNKIGRNDPCPCGSGKKYKKCCGR